MEATKAELGGILDWLSSAIAWLGQQDLPALLTEAKALYDAVVAALADGKVTFMEGLAIVTKFIALLGKLKLAGFKAGA